VARNILLLNKGEQTKKLVYSRSGQILSLDKKCISLLGGMTLTESFCEQRINISALKKKAHIMIIISHQKSPCHLTLLIALLREL
jgi:hypothetical protein